MNMTVPHILTPREVEVLSLLARGRSSRQIGESLGISKRTVDAHSQAIIWKLGALNRAQAVAIAVSDGMVTVE
jgi:DNA-binding NarL/FixJ family response regulator